MKSKRPGADKKRVIKNTVAANPLMGKSSRHEKSKKAKRQQEKVALKKTWFEQVAAQMAIYSNHVFTTSRAAICL